MNERGRYLYVQLFRSADRIPFSPGNGRESTRNRWYREGLPEGLTGLDLIHEAFRQAAGFPFPSEPKRLAWVVIDHMMNPKFEEKVIEIRENSQVVQDWKGNICEIGLEFDVSYLRSALDFVTRNWLKCPVENRSDWEEMKKRYNPDDPARILVTPPSAGMSWDDRTNPIIWHVHGPYWQLREWCGFENLSMMFYDEPGLVAEMIDFWEEYVLRLMEHGLKHVTPDEFFISEDMAYKGHSMISPEMAERFLLPTWKRWGDRVKKAGIPLYSMDSDGYIGELIPLWIKAGIHVCEPVEVAAGNDLVALRREFGHDMAFRGGVDKREIARGGKFIEREMERLRPVMEDGGYIPGCDHGVPSDVSWPDFVHYCRLLGEATGWIKGSIP